MVTLDTLPEEIFIKCGKFNSFTRVWESHWDQPLDIQNNILNINPILLVDESVKSIVVLREYEELCKRIEEDRANHSTAALIVGTPGIGKSTFLPYLLLCLISKREPVVYYRGNGYYVFMSDGVYTPVGGDTLVFLTPEFGRVHALVDADSLSAVSMFSDPTLKLYTILVSSPREDRIKKYIKARGAAKLIPAPPSLDEAFAVWTLCFPDKVNKFNVDELHWELKSFIDALSIATLRGYIANPDSATIEISHRCIETFSLPDHPNRLLHRLRSRTVLRVFYGALALKDLQERQQLYHLFQSGAQLSVSQGYLFEVMADDLLSQGFQGMLEPEDGSNVEQLDLDYLTIQLFSNASDPNSTTEEDKFYIPVQGNNPTYDAFCYKDGCGIAMQHTISKKHPHNLKGLRDLNKQFNTAGMKKKWFIFVIPKGTQFKYPPLPACRAGWKYFTLELDVNWTSASQVPEREIEDSDLDATDEGTDDDEMDNS
ncbi:hypothetical protein GYMLUDRAFT_987794 [Collybiopsis luxurians FD-317 M1]|uniref:Crinkler (CRN) family protein n=1 Tax=Collybiopsis luxurians FD-317 M1 TaxID=944289 RepID=A0A0D0C6P3_9AGAR|nr:hypothetical protein GYMLUDRAFT_987794 [Collybiopsis luxurians FD-317 M1]